MISGYLSSSSKIVFGTFVLLLVNIIWVLSSEISHFIYVDSEYNKPFFTTYIKTCMFSLLLTGFVFFRSWRAQCIRYPHSYHTLESFEDGRTEESEDDNYSAHPLGDPTFEPIRVQCTPPSSRSCSSCSSGDTTPLPGRVKFSSLVEVRSLSDSEESRMARMSYSQGIMYERHQRSMANQYANSSHVQKLSLIETMRVALTFSILSFFGGWAYSEALSLAEPSVVNIISATSGIFVCVLAALFPSNATDHFTFSKLAAAFLSAVGVVLVTMASSRSPLPPSPQPPNSTVQSSSGANSHNSVTNQTQRGAYYVVLPTILDNNDQHLASVGPVKNSWKSFLSFPSNDEAGSTEGGISSAQLGVIWALMGAFVYSVYLVTLKHQVGNEENLNIAMFYGFVGVFNMVLIGPGLYVFHALGWEKFELPPPDTLGYIVINGLVGTVLSEFLWLWGCFLTSSLAATLSLSMTTPLSMLTDAVFRHQHFSWHLYVGSVPVVLSFFLVTIFQQYNNWDPLGDLFSRISSRTHSRKRRSSPGGPKDSRDDGSGGSRGGRVGGVTAAATCGSRKLRRAARGATTGFLSNVIPKKKKKSGVRLSVEADSCSSDEDTRCLVISSPSSPSSSPTPSSPPDPPESHQETLDQGSRIQANNNSS
ncbi:solute carrier family 35 member F5-like isoform X2 [Convolutriloba macropyga]|uniref:solute carrier family 35 member F5-like isoform X2 n=1 Tax=Convolutriloba macropyga TaxID=536237 RepID=UPI003F51F817